MIEAGRTEYITQLKLMWSEIFGDSMEYLDSFFAHVYKDENTLVFIEDGKVVSALYMIPYNMIIEETKTPIIYLYALATDPHYRGRKIMSDLINRSLEISSDRGYALSVLIPASESLFDYYSQFGYEECFEQLRITRTRDEIIQAVNENAIITEDVSTTELFDFVGADADRLWEVYSKSRFYSNCCVVLSKEQNKFFMNEYEKEGGEAFVFGMKDRDGIIYEGYAIMKVTEDHLEILESNVDVHALISFYEFILEKYSFSDAVFIQPVCFSEEESLGNKKPFAMARKLKQMEIKKAFINRVLM